MRWLLVATLALGACVGGYGHLDPTDPALPIEARRALAASEDDVAIAQLEESRAQGDLDRQLAWAKDVERRLGVMKSGGSDMRTLTPAWKTANEARSRFARLGLKVARAQVELMRARARVSRAETARRFDLGVPPLARPLEELASATERVLEARNDLDAQEVEVERSVDELWQIYQDWVRAGGRSEPLFDAGLAGR